MTSFLRAAVVAAAALLLPACTAIVPIDVTHEVPLQAPSGAFDTSHEIDLSTNATLWSHKDEVDAVSIDEVTATVLSVAGDNQASSVTLALRFRPEGAPADGSRDVQLGSLGALTLVPGAKATLSGSAALDDLLIQVVKGSGKFTALAVGSVNGDADAVLEVGLKGSMSYKIGN